MQKHFGVYEILPALHHQIEYSSAVLVNKSDLVDEDRLIQVSEKVGAINPEANLYITSCANRRKRDGRKSAPTDKKPKESTNTPETRLKTFVLKSEHILPYENLMKFINQIADATYRIKGLRKPIRFCTSECGRETCNGFRMEKTSGRDGAGRDFIRWDQTDQHTDERNRKNLEGKIHIRGGFS